MEDPKDTGPGSVVARADALMQRRRQNAARSGEIEEVPVLTDVVDPDDDLPVLTVMEEISIEAPAEVPAEIPAQAPDEAPPEAPAEIPAAAPDDVPAEALVTAPTTAPAEASAEEAPPPTLDHDLMAVLAHELTRRVHQRLAAELPSLVEAALQSTLADLTRELRSGIEETAEGAIRDFLNDGARLAKLHQKR